MPVSCGHGCKGVVDHEGVGVFVHMRSLQRVAQQKTVVQPVTKPLVGLWPQGRSGWISPKWSLSLDGVRCLW